MLRLLAALAGPMFAKEMIEISRRKRYYFNRLLYGAGLLAILLVIWEEHGGGRTYLNRQQLIQHMASLAAAMFEGVGWVQLVAVYLFVPVFVCGTIANEREAGTLDLLLTTQLDDREIVLGKLGSRFLIMMALVISAVPIFSLVMLFGGIAPEGLWRTQAAMLLSVLFAGSFAIYFSAISRTPLGALIRTYWWLTVYLALLPALIVWFADEIIGGRADDYAAAGMALVNPCFSFAAAIDQSLYNGFARYVGQGFFGASFVVPLALSLILMWQAVARLRMKPVVWTRLVGLRNWIRHKHELWNGLKEELARRRGLRADRTLFGGEIENPLWLRSRRRRVYDREGHMGRAMMCGWLVAAIAMLLMLLSSPRDLADEEAAFAFVGLSWLGVLLLTIIVSASSLVGDRRRGLLELMLAAPLEPREFLDGTLLAVWEHLRPIVLLPWVLTGVFVVTTASHPVGAACSLITATLFTTCVLMLGVFCSLAARQPAGALAPTFIFPVVMIVVTFFVIGLFGEAHCAVLWVGIALAVPLGVFWTRRSLNPASVATRFVSMHLLFCGLATCWAAASDHLEHPLADMHPMYLTMVFLQEEGPFSSRREPDGFTCAALPFYWLGMLANLAWGRAWMIRHFDRIAGRL